MWTYKGIQDSSLQKCLGTIMQWKPYRVVYVYIYIYIHYIHRYIICIEMNAGLELLEA